ncbi:MAG TPA: right-handed parallel beta-helix repeat-containing protein [Myxococcaceae bacterium]
MGGQAAPAPDVAPDVALDNGSSAAGNAVVYLREWYVSPTGSDSAPGTSTQPFRTITRALSAVGPGERINVSAGTYAERVRITGSVRAGTASAPIRLQGVGKPKIVPNADSGSLVQIEKPYWQVDGFEVDVQGKAYYAAHFAGNVTGSVLSHGNLHGGTAGTGVSTHYACVGATISDNEIHHFQKPGDDSHGILVQPGSKQISILRNVIHDNSGDSIQCIGPEGLSAEPPADGVLIQDNTMYHDHEQAVDVKTCYNVTIKHNVMRDYLEALPGGCSLVVHMSAREVLIEDNDIFNVGKAIAIGGNHVGPVPYHVVVKQNRIRNVVKGYQLEGIGIKLENSQMARVFNNTFVGVGFAAITAGGGDQGYTTDLMIKDNIISTGNGTAYGIYLSPYYSVLLSRYNLFAPGTLFSAVTSGSRRTLTLDGWRSATGQDGPSRQVDPQLDPATMMPGPPAVDWGEYVGVPWCGAGPDIGAVESGCP